MKALFLFAAILLATAAKAASADTVYYQAVTLGKPGKHWQWKTVENVYYLRKQDIWVDYQLKPLLRGKWIGARVYCMIDHKTY